MRHLIALAVMALAVTGCAASGQSEEPAATPETAAAPSGHPPAVGRSTAWLDDLAMVSAADGWALIWSSDPAGRGNPTLRPERTSDGGRTWVVVTPPAARPLLANGQAVLYSGSAQRAWIAVNGGDSESTVVFATNDGGRRWTESNAVAGSQAVAIDFSGADRGWLLVAASAAMGEQPVRVYGTEDGGNSWSLLTGDLPAACDKTGMEFTSAKTGWITSVCPVGYQVLVSRDGGARWAAAQLPVPDSACQDGCTAFRPEVAGPGTVLEMGSYPAAAVLFFSTNGGQTWRTESMPTGAGSYPRVTFFGPADAIAVSAGASGVIGQDFFVTSNSGQSWTAVPQGRRFGSSGASFDFVSPQLGFSWIPGGQQLYRTQDSGRTWTTVAAALG
jgi:hypothetical protein